MDIILTLWPSLYWHDFARLVSSRRSKKWCSAMCKHKGKDLCSSFSWVLLNSWIVPKIPVTDCRLHEFVPFSWKCSPGWKVLDQRFSSLTKGEWPHLDPCLALHAVLNSFFTCENHFTMAASLLQRISVSFSFVMWIPVFFRVSNFVLDPC